MAIQSYEDFYTQLEYARSLIVDASTWFAAKSAANAEDRMQAVALKEIVSELMGWCEDNLPANR